ncbi:hypothetical protein IV102_10495 [bacterium]|nr:hypothetical protein [bacterium]
MVISKRGRLSSADRERIHALAERGHSIEEISRELERREDVIEGILEEKQASARTRKAAPKPSGNGVPVSKKSQPKGLLSHFIWVRPGFQIELTLPADLSEGEAERLSVMVKSLPFTG